MQVPQGKVLSSRTRVVPLFPDETRRLKFDRPRIGRVERTAPIAEAQHAVRRHHLGGSRTACPSRGTRSVWFGAG
jgi:hypothetical protein